MDARKNFTEKTAIVLRAEQVTRPGIEGLKKIIQQFYGPCPVSLTIHFDKRGEVDIDVPKDMTIEPCREFRDKITDLMDDTRVIYQQKTVEPQQNGKRAKWQRR